MTTRATRTAEWALLGAVVAPQLISAFLLGYAISMPVSGFVADVIGARRLLIIGPVGVGLAALIPLLAPGWPAMLVSRFLIGLLGCASTVVTRIYIQRCLPGERHMPALSLLAIGVAISLVSMSYFAVLSHGAEAMAGHDIGSGLMGVLLGIAVMGFIGGTTFLGRTRSLRHPHALMAAAVAGLVGAVIVAATQAELLELDLPRHAIASGLFFFIQLVGGAAYSMILDATSIAGPAQLSVAAIVPLAGILALLGVTRLRR